MAPDHEPVDTAWKIHAAIADWTGKVDSKASFVSAIESALLAGIVGMTGGTRRLSNLTGSLANGFLWLGIVILVASLVMALYVVRPRLRSKEIRGEVPANFIFFGHVRDWMPDELAEAIKDRDILPVLSRQLVAMSKIAWRKHRLVQLSILGAMVASGLVALAAALK